MSMDHAEAEQRLSAVLLACLEALDEGRELVQFQAGFCVSGSWVSQW